MLFAPTSKQESKQKVGLSNTTNPTEKGGFDDKDVNLCTNRLATSKCGWWSLVTKLMK